MSIKTILITAGIAFVVVIASNRGPAFLKRIAGTA